MSQEPQEVKPAPGIYKGKLAAYGNTKTQGGKLAPTMMFAIQDGETTRHVYWRGFYNEGKAREITLETLIKCGLRDVKGIAKIADGVDSGVLNTEQEYDITVIHETQTEGKNAGRKYARAQFVNPSGAARFHGAIDAKESQILMNGLGLEADFMAIAQSMGLNKASKPAEPDPTVPF